MLDVIKHLDAEQGAGINEATRQLEVVRAGARIAAGMVVRQDDCRGVGQQRHLEHLIRRVSTSVGHAAGAGVCLGRRIGRPHEARVETPTSARVPGGLPVSCGVILIVNMTGIPRDDQRDRKPDQVVRGM